MLLAFDLHRHLVSRLAGFAVRVTPPEGRPYWLLNRLSFDTPVTASTTPEQRLWTPTNEAPLQRFRWLHVPAQVVPGAYLIEATAMLFRESGSTALEPGPSTWVTIDLAGQPFSALRLGFTRGYLSSQAYATRFHNAAIAPKPRTIDFDTRPFQKRYAWLGFHARELLFEFLDECERDPRASLDVFAYDLDEPDVVRALQRLGPRLRIFLDDASLHRKASALEPQARVLLEASAGADHVRTGHFGRFAHDKVMIQRHGQRNRKVLTGSANFSVRGLYVQANSVLVFDDTHVAGLYADAFEQAWTDPRGFASSKVAADWLPIRRHGLPEGAVSFAPHASAEVSLARVADAIAAADSSVLFAVMELRGSGPVLERLQALARSSSVFAEGMTQRTDGSLSVLPPGKRGLLVPFAYLSEQVPQPFRQEWSGGSGQVIHHKFVVVDFNGGAPVVFAGSSNLAAGGETHNGDNLLAIEDRAVATTYAIEAIRLVDHYYFRALARKATTAEPLRLRTQKERWWAPYYRAGIKKQERELLVR